MFESNYLATILDMKMEVTALDIKLGSCLKTGQHSSFLIIYKENKK